MRDAPEKIRVAQDSDGFWTCREAVSGSQEYVRSDLVAELAVTREMVNAAYNTGKDRCMTGAPNDFRAVLKAAIKAAMEARL